ncbi:hypothetical protein [Blastococcus sp. TF02-8]|uniref:hypothetical protein n=1 Tax=Blastococcus sp. TF02-8 TaxID=2250574 RepID=UPI0011BED1AE|nr:hypothetical protein [Blastococcus sp. TF02-8]
MVTNALAADELPPPGEPVEVDWGLESVQGHVVEVFSGPRPRVLVEIDPGQVGEEAATVTVPAQTITPSESATSPWAHHVRYEQAVSAAISRLAGASVRRVERSPSLSKMHADVVVELADGRVMLVEAKTWRGPANESQVKGVVDQLREYARRVGGYGLLVVDRDVPSSNVQHREDQVRVVRWRGAQDDRELGRALKELPVE